VSVVEEERTVERKTAHRRPRRIERSGGAKGAEEPQERCGDVAAFARELELESLAWIRVEQTVERVRNLEGGRCREVVVASRDIRTPGSVVR